jgi:hypothetical protein
MAFLWTASPKKTAFLKDTRGPVYPGDFCMEPQDRDPFKGDRCRQLTREKKGIFVFYTRFSESSEMM